MMQQNNRQKQEGKLKKDDKQKQKQTSTEEEISGTSISADSISKKQQTASVTENISEVVETTSSKPCSSRQTESQNQSSLLGKRRVPPSNEIIGYVESVSPPKEIEEIQRITVMLFCKLKVQRNAELYAFLVQKGNFFWRKRTTKQLLKFRNIV